MIELLVVIAIIVILVALLLPTLSRVKERGCQIACLSNLRQLQIAWGSYAGDNANVMPENHAVGAGQFTAASPTNSWIMGNAQASADLSNIRNGTIFNYTPNEGVYHCPTDRSQVPGTNALRVRSYSMDCYLNGGTSVAGTPAGVVIRLDEVKPGLSGVFVFLDENEQSIDDGFYLLYRAPDLTWPNLVADRHSRGANLSFADGHCERWKWRAPKPFETYGQVASTTEDAQDLARLQAALPNPP